MGFENRKSMRVKTGISLCFWPQHGAEGPSHWGQVSNLSETGLAMAASAALAPGSEMLLEFSLDGRGQPLRVPARVVHCEAGPSPDRPHMLRVQFLRVAGEERMLIRRFILQVADPKLAAQTGWGHAYFPGCPAIEAKYRELSPAERQQSLEDRSYLAMKEIGYLFKFQAYLESALGAKLPSNFRLLGSRPLKAASSAWLELNFEGGHLHLLASVLWGDALQGEKAESGMAVAAIHREEALKIEKLGLSK
jgi:hypothetical protein